MQNNSDEHQLELETSKREYTEPTLIDYGSVRELTQDYAVATALISVAVAVL